jgi:hypothetical protein
VAAEEFADAKIITLCTDPGRELLGRQGHTVGPLVLIP